MPDAWDFTTRRRSQGPDPLAQTPILTYLLVVLCVVITTASLTSGSLGPSNQMGTLLYRIGSFGFVSPEEIWSGRYWGLVTTVFIHGSWLHLLFNMLWMIQLGRILERTLNIGIYLLFLIAAAVVGSGCEMLVSGQTGIGMSGVVYAMFGLMWAGRGLYPAWAAIATRGNFQYMVGWALLCVVATYIPIFHIAIANGAHGGGFLFGLSIGYLFYSPRPKYLWAIPLTLVVGLTILAITWVPWSREWTFWKGNQEFEHKRYTQAIHWYQSSLAHGGDVHDNWYNIGVAWNRIAVDALAHKDTTTAEKAMVEADTAAKNAGPGEDNP